MKEKEIIATLKKWRETGKIGELGEVTLLAGFIYKLKIALNDLIIPDIKKKWKKISPEKREKIIFKLYELLQLLESEEIKKLCKEEKMEEIKDFHGFDELKFIKWLYKNIIKNKCTIARITGFSIRTIYRWLKADKVNMFPLVKERVNKIRKIFEALIDALPEEAIIEWLNSYNRYLGRKPIDFLEQREYEKVHSATMDLRDNIL